MTNKASRSTFLQDVDELCSFTAENVSKLISRKSVSVSDYLSALIKQIKRAEPSVNAWQYIDYERAHDYVLELEKEFSQKTDEVDVTKLYGIPFGIKDIFNTDDMPH